VEAEEAQRNAKPGGRVPRPTLTGAFAGGGFIYGGALFYFLGDGKGTEAFYSAAAAVSAGLFVAVALGAASVASSATAPDLDSGAGALVAVAALYVAAGVVFSLIAINECHGGATTSSCGNHLDFSLTYAGIAGGIAGLIGAGFSVSRATT
jgi:hypothetical protein